MIIHYTRCLVVRDAFFLSSFLSLNWQSVLSFSRHQSSSFFRSRTPPCSCLKNTYFFFFHLIVIAHLVPNRLTLTAEASTVNSVSATWTKEENITGYEITCSSGTASPSSGHDTLTGSSCVNLPTAGEEYNMTITYSGQRNESVFKLRACK